MEQTGEQTSNVEWKAETVAFWEGNRKPVGPSFQVTYVLGQAPTLHELEKVRMGMRHIRGISIPT